MKPERALGYFYLRMSGYGGASLSSQYGTCEVEASLVDSEFHAT